MSLCFASMIVTAIIVLILCEISYFMFFKQLIEMNFVLGKALISLLLQNFIPTFPDFFVEGHIKACEGISIRGCWRP